MRALACLLLVCATNAHATSASAQTSDGSLRARARAEGGEATNFMSADFSSYSVPELALRADVIVHGRVLNVRPHLTVDESMIVTDVTVGSTRMLKETVPTSRRTQPGPTASLIVRYAGGTVVEGGLKMSTRMNVFPADEPLVVGEDLILFLLYDAKEQVFELVDGPFAAFRIKESRVHSMTRSAARRTGHGPAPVATFLADVERYVRERKPGAPHDR